MKIVYPHLQEVELPLPQVNGFSSLPELSLVEAKLEEILGSSPGSTRDICQYLLSAGGKRIRPLLACISGQLCQANSQDVVTCAAALELVHMASLVHDDVIDNSDTRRGRPSINALWGNHVAVLAGDFLFAKAFRLLSVAHLLPVLELVVEAIDAMCDGEIEQAISKGNLKQTEKHYLDRVEKKTGKLIAASCSIGALLAGNDPLKLFSLQNYGKCVGYAFQIIDDLLDFQGNAKTLGKPVGLDLEQGNLTLPLLKLLEHPEYGRKTEELLSQLPLTPLQENEIFQALQASGAFDASYLQAQKFIDASKQQLEVFESSWPATAMSCLADYVLDRIH